MEDNKKITREFKLTTLSLQNKSTVYVLTFIFVVFGIISYRSLPKELFPDITIPTVFVQTIYPGNPPSDMENLVTRPLEKELESVKGVTQVTSTSTQDASLIFVEFVSTMDIETAIQDVKDAVDKTKSDLPDNLPSDPMVMDIDFSEFPILNINLSGDYSIKDLNEFAEYLQDEIERVYEISKVEIKGIDSKEIKINVDQAKLDAFSLSFNDIETAIAYENVSISGGEILMGNTRRSLRTTGEFTSMEDIKNIIIKHDKGNIVYLRDVAEVVEGYEEPKSFARLNQQPVVSIQVIKKSGENLLSATDQVFDILDLAKEDGHLPEDVNITITNDMSESIRSQLSNLENSMIMGVIFVVGILFFFLGIRNALFVGIAIPLSMFLSFVVLGALNITISMIVLFSLILALGMLVDNAIVAVENIYRFIDQGYSVYEATKQAVGEIAVPIISSTATTLAAFIPLIFWEGIIGEFMKILPITLIIVLTASLIVALVMTPVFATTFVQKEKNKPLNKKKRALIACIMVGVAIIFHLLKFTLIANLLLLFALLGFLNILFLHKFAGWFQYIFLAKLENFYSRVINFTLRGKNYLYFIFGTFAMVFVTMFFYAARQPDVVTFPVNEPKYINIYAELPIGSDVKYTDTTMKIIEDKVFQIMKPYQHIVTSYLTTVGEGVARGGEFTVSTSLNKGVITIQFLDYQLRGGLSTTAIMKELSDGLLNKVAGVNVFVEKDENGPPTGNPVNLEITGQDMDKLIAYSDTISNLLAASGIEGIEKLMLDIELGKPELVVNIERDKARRFGLSTAQIASTIRTALFGKEVSNYKIGEDEYPIQLRMADNYRYDLASLMNQLITFRNNRGQLLQVPISAVAELEFSSTYGSIRRKDLTRAVTLYSNVIEGYNPTAINQQITSLLSSYKMEDGYAISLTGEQEEQQKSMNFLMKAMLIAMAAIFLILVTQFNSMVKPLIIMTSVLFSTIGVFGGLATFKMDFVVIMTGIGIISLAGVVVNNAIVLIDYIDFLKANKKKELGIEDDDALPLDEIKNCIVKAGKTRLRPVLLTAITTVLGLVPMALGMNINFETMLSEYDPQIYFGGDNALFWGPMSWTVIFGLTFSTFLTLVIVPALYLFANYTKLFVLKVIRKVEE